MRRSCSIMNAMSSRTSIVRAGIESTAITAQLRNIAARTICSNGVDSTTQMATRRRGCAGRMPRAVDAYTRPLGPRTVIGGRGRQRDRSDAPWSNAGRFLPTVLRADTSRNGFQSSGASMAPQGASRRGRLAGVCAAAAANLCAKHTRIAKLLQFAHCDLRILSRRRAAAPTSNRHRRRPT